MKHLGTLPFHAEASRGGTSSRRPGYLEPHRAGVKACAEHGNSLETTPAAPVVGGFFRPLSGGVPMQWIAVGVCAALRQARHPSAAAGEPMCCGAARQKPRFARRRTPRPALDPAKPLSGGMTTCERFWNAPPQAERLERRSCHPSADRTRARGSHPSAERMRRCRVPTPGEALRRPLSCNCGRPALDPKGAA